MRNLLGVMVGLSFGLAFVACSSDESAGPGAQSDASTTGGASATGGKSSGGATAGTGGASSGGKAGAAGSGGASGAGGAANGGAGASGTGGSAGNDAGAGGSPGDGGTDGDAALARTLTWDFTSNAEGWTGGFADYPSGEETFYELAFAQSAMPAEVGPGGGLKIAGNNHSDDLFMFVARGITGFAPNTAYVLDIEARIATNAPSDCAGIGGSPGTSVFFKIGAVAESPVSAPSGDAAAGSQTMQINLDKGNQGTGGSDMQVAGDIANTKLCPDETYQLKTLSLTGFSVTSDASGRVWIVLGTDSGFEGTTVLYYDRVTVTIRPA